jgi:hypothetical protein
MELMEGAPADASQLYLERLWMRRSLVVVVVDFVGLCGR